MRGFADNFPQHSEEAEKGELFHSELDKFENEAFPAFQKFISEFSENKAAYKRDVGDSINNSGKF